jgi:sialic acid synthase SpsE
MSRVALLLVVISVLMGAVFCSYQSLMQKIDELEETGRKTAKDYERTWVIVASKDIKKGTIFTEENVQAKQVLAKERKAAQETETHRTGSDINPTYLILGKKSARDLRTGEVLKQYDLDPLPLRSGNRHRDSGYRRLRVQN